RVTESGSIMQYLSKIRSNVRWLPNYLWQRATRKRDAGRVHVILSLADHFEPGIVPGKGSARAAKSEQERRIETWFREIPRVLDRWRDAEGRPFYHTYFFSAEQYDPDLIEALAEHCRDGWGEVEIHLHHGVEAPDTREHTEKQIIEFRDALAHKHGCLSQWNDAGPVRYAFVHGNFALANSKKGRACGVDSEMQVLCDTGCYADFTMPSAPDIAQVPKINSVYECGLPLDKRAPHRTGTDLEAGRPPRIFPLMIQGPLMLDFSRPAKGARYPHIENGALTWKYPANMKRFQLWRRAGITVKGRPDWIFIKLHCHGMDPRDSDAMYGAPLREFLRELLEDSQKSGQYSVHFTTAREMTN